MTDISWSMQWHSFGLHHMATKCLDTKKSFNREISLATYIHTSAWSTWELRVQTKKYSQMKWFPLYLV